MAKFVGYNNDSVFTRLSPFFDLGKSHICLSFDVVNFSNSITRERLNNIKSYRYFSKYVVYIKTCT